MYISIIWPLSCAITSSILVRSSNQRNSDNKELQRWIVVHVCISGKKIYEFIKFSIKKSERNVIIKVKL